MPKQPVHFGEFVSPWNERLRSIVHPPIRMAAIANDAPGIPTEMLHDTILVP